MAITFNQLVVTGVTVASLGISVPAGWYYSSSPKTLRQKYESKGIVMLKDGDSMKDWAAVIQSKNNNINLASFGFPLSITYKLGVANPSENYAEIGKLKAWCGRKLDMHPIWVGYVEYRLVQENCAKKSS